MSSGIFFIDGRRVTRFEYENYKATLGQPVETKDASITAFKYPYKRVIDLNCIDATFEEIPTTPIQLLEAKDTPNE